ncbi:glycosyltransferase family 22 protein [Dendrothele bispora CBS 962.96]|uniref:Mannosyltransferase n=1 Tax=Dendrothele bispora (strain CBS 962.96) TaxID=1314807 RepID=A0A4S8MW16_DENBC|nr:glycosyltransferase family 22 protein [Dendrothele bispora CBS 962.96]
MSNAQTIRLRRPGPEKPQTATPKKVPNDTFLQDQVRRTARPPWTPSFGFALRMLLLFRVTAAMYSNIDDCDEVFNFWEPLHFFDRNYGFQTWEVTPQYAIRSWAYILMHLFPVRVARFLAVDEKRVAFFAVRIFLAIISSLTEVTLYRAVCEKVNLRVGRYLFFILFFSAGMWNASAALLPSSFAMYTTTLAFAFSMTPSTTKNARRTLFATLTYAVGAIIGWPFALALSVPFVFEELFVLSGDKVLPPSYTSWLFGRWKRLFGAGTLASLIFLPVIAVDTLAYGRLSVVPLNIVTYNIFSSDRGPDLYGTSPPSLYLLNLLLNFNILVPFALFAYPALAITYLFDKGRLGLVRPSQALESSPFTVLSIRLAPFYLWLAILTAQAHKEERFMFPAYTMLCFNAAVTLYLVRGWMETVFIKFTKSPYRASRSSIFSSFTTSVITVTAVISISRIFANWHYYHAPLSIAYHFETKELPSLLNLTGLIKPDPVPLGNDRYRREEKRIDLSPIRHLNLTLCLGKEWYRFPGHYLVPEHVRVEFVKSEFEGLLPGHFPESANASGTSSWWPRPQTRIIPEDQNDLNKEELSHYIPVETCTHLIDLDYPSHPVESALEPRYAVQSDTWERVECLPFLDARHSPMLSRVLWVPGEKWRQLNAWGDYCLLRNKKLISSKIEEVKAKASSVLE